MTSASKPYEICESPRGANEAVVRHLQGLEKESRRTGSVGFFNLLAMRLILLQDPQY